MARAGLVVESQTLWDQLFGLSRCFKDVMVRLHEYLPSKQVLLADETRWPLLGVTGRATKNWFDWVLVAEDAVLHSIHETRSNEAADAVLGEFHGVLLTDGYGVFGSRAQAIGFVQAHDWCHARRRFIDAESTAPETAKVIIGALSVIEREIVDEFTGMNLDDALALRRRRRQERQKPIVEEIGRIATEMRALSDSPIARAVKYLENQWPGLIRFLDDPRIPITSNAAEAALRCLVLGRNNHFGSKSKRGTEAAAMFYSLIESAKMNGLDPGAYLRHGAEAFLRGERVPLPHELRDLAIVRPWLSPPTVVAIEAGAVV